MWRVIMTSDKYGAWSNEYERATEALEAVGRLMDDVAKLNDGVKRRYEIEEIDEEEVDG